MQQPIRPIESFTLSLPFEGRVRISPQAAENIIKALNIGNRRVRRVLVEYLKAQIRNGEWQEDHPQKIIFSAKPRLIDGQHRLIAIVEAGIEVVAGVVLGARDELRE
jgi:hypothetical protein